MNLERKEKFQLRVAIDSPVIGKSAKRKGKRRKMSAAGEQCGLFRAGIAFTRLSVNTKRRDAFVGHFSRMNFDVDIPWLVVPRRGVASTSANKPVHRISGVTLFHTGRKPTGGVATRRDNVLQFMHVGVHDRTTIEISVVDQDTLRDTGRGACWKNKRSVQARRGSL